jgi:ABC-type antimicrobial peptide transport system permease subunit
VYVPFAQGGMRNTYFRVRPRSPQPALADAVRREIRAEAPGLPLFGAQAFASHIESSIEYWALRLSAALFGAFGGLAMVVALVGIYGVLSHAVARRTREFGIRMAVGATAGAVRQLALRDGLATTLLGIGIGWLLGLGVGRVLSGIFVDVASFDALVSFATPITFIAGAAVAAWIPARRATRVNPVTALRAE